MAVPAALPSDGTFSISIVIIVAAFIAAPVYFIGSGLYNTFFHPLSKIPGPKIYAFTQIPYLYHLSRGNWHEVLKNLHNKYGTAVRFAPNDVSFITSDAIKKIYGHKSGGDKTFEKHKLFYGQIRDAPDIINANNEDHKRMRRLLSHAFSEKALRNQEDVLKHYIDEFINKLTEESEKGNIVDIVRWYNFATFDLIGDLAFGEPFGCLKSGGYHPWVKLIFESVKILPIRHITRRLGVEKWISVLAPPSWKKGADEHWELSKQTALRRLDTQNMEREDFMSYILRHNDKNGLTQAEILVNANILIIAGSETTATLLSGTTFQILTNRHVYDQLVMEIRTAFGSEDEITFNAVNQLKYLIAVFNEGLRMYPPVPSNLPRASPPGGEVVEGYFIPENTSVSVPHWSAYRADRNFRNPDKFAPERWLNDPSYDSDDKTVLQPFSFGPRNCIGKNLANAEMRLMLTRLLWKFDLEIMQDSLSWDKQDVFILWEKGDLNVRLTEVER